MGREKAVEGKASSAAAGPQITRILEPGCTAFSAAEIRVAVAPVGDLDPGVLKRYYELISKHRQIVLQSINPFYTAQQKSPFKAFPWKQGSIHLRFLPEETALKPSPLNCLHTHRNVLGVIGICHCPSNPDLGEAYAKFESLARKFPGAMSLRCFAFQPSQDQVTAENEKRQKISNLMMFPSTDDEDEIDQLENHANFLLLDFAAGLLAGIERWMLTASPNMIDLNTFADTSEKFLGPTSLLTDMSRRFPATPDEETTKKKRLGRMQKAMGDFSLLAGSPSDASDHYASAIELARQSLDYIWLAAAYMGMANAKTMEHCLEIGEATAPMQGDNSEMSELSASKQRRAKMRAASQVSATSNSMGPEFWESLKRSSLEEQIKPLYASAKEALDAKSTLYARRGSPVLQVEADLQLARLLAGLHGSQARREVSEKASQIQEAGLQLLLAEDRLYAMMEAAQVLGLVGSGRKRILILWQAVEASRALGISNEETLQIARKALEPPDDPREAEDESELLTKARPLQSSVPQHWNSVRAACIEGVLSTAIMAERHADVWDAAALLLREHYWDVTLGRQESLITTLRAAASKMLPAQFRREGSGPPPLISFTRAVPLPPHLLPRTLSAGTKGIPASSDSKSPFLYNPLESKGAESDKPGALWVAGETATVEIQIWNPTAQNIEVERVTLDATNSGDPSVAMIDQDSSPPSWKPFAFSMTVPPNAPPSKVYLTGIPIKKGLYTVTGCTVTWNRISWQQPWTVLPGKHAFLRPKTPDDDAGGLAQERVTVAEPLPLLNGRLVPFTKSGGAQDEAEQLVGSDKPPPLLEVMALKGQVVDLKLLIKNTGKLNISHAAVYTDIQSSSSLDPMGSKGRSYNVKQPHTDAQSRLGRNAKPNPLLVEVDQTALKQQFPVKNGSQLSMPILIHNSESATFGSEESSVLDFRIEYHGKQATAKDSSGSDGPSDPQIGRILHFPLSIKFTASLQINNVRIFEHHEAAPEGNAGPEIGLARRRCVMELEVSNRANALQIWVAPKHLPGLDSPAWKTAVNHPRPWQKGGAAGKGQPASLACRIVPSQASMKVAAFVDQLVDDLREENETSLQPSLIAKAMTDRFAVYWRREEDLNDTGAAVDVGCLNIPVDQIERALSSDVQNLLVSKPLHAQFTLDRPESATPNGVVSGNGETLLMTPPAELSEEDVAFRGAVWGLKAKLGQPLRLSLQVENSAEAEASVSTSIACHSAEISADSSRQIDDPNVLPAGVTTMFKLQAKPQQTAKHTFALCFLLPGLYCLYLSNLAVDGSLPSKHNVRAENRSNSLLSVRTSYVYVE